MAMVYGTGQPRPSLSESCGRYRATLRPLFQPLFRAETVEVFDWRCPGHDTPAHEEEYADAYAVVVVRRGAFVREVDGRPAFIPSGTLMFATPGEGYRFRHPAPGGDACSVFQASTDSLREMLGELDPVQGEAPNPRLPLAQAPIGGREYLLQRLAMRAAALGGDPVEKEESALRFLWAALAYAAARSGRGARCRPRLTGAAWARALDYVVGVHEVIRRRFQDRLTLAGIGREVGCSPFHLSRLMTEVTGLSIHRHLVRHRLHQALERVLDSRENLSAIAFATGFSSHSHLTDTFRREFGRTPDRIRRSPPRRDASPIRPRT
jgi:AraC-like DNA-binding protein